MVRQEGRGGGSSSDAGGDGAGGGGDATNQRQGRMSLVPGRVQVLLRSSRVCVDVPALEGHVSSALRCVEHHVSPITLALHKQWLIVDSIAVNDRANRL